MERIDEIGFGGLRLIQDPQEFCYGVDAVLLAGFAADNCGTCRSIVELGAGNGAVSLILCHKTDAGSITAVEVQPGAAALAARNAALNGLQDRMHVLNTDIKVMDTERLKCDVVVTNPPYMEGGRGVTNPESPRHVARHETTASLRDFFAAAGRLLPDGGQLFMVHRPARLTDIISIAREYELEPKIMRMVSPSPGNGANIVLLKCVRGGGRELKVLPELYVRDDNGEYTEEIKLIYEKQEEQ
ncbi:MAG: tRNA1(Val) (adenine(37)-N6)-methyltransferase [Anaerovoracaceae bacterium]|jgi:tRNA1Val (adenine37-N6)-methyltransferase